jgi:hypothetical protein
MAHPDEQQIMAEIGLGQHYTGFNGSLSCGFYLRNQAIERLPDALASHGMTLAPAWAAHVRKAALVDQVISGDYSLTNVWIACSYAIQDALYRAAGSPGIIPEECWQFFSARERSAWQQYEGTRSRRYA